MFCATIYCMQKQFFSGVPTEVGVISHLIYTKAHFHPVIANFDISAMTILGFSYFFEKTLPVRIVL